MPPKSSMLGIEDGGEETPLFSYHDDDVRKNKEESSIPPNVDRRLIAGSLLLAGFIWVSSIIYNMKINPHFATVPPSNDRKPSSLHRTSRYKKFQALGFQIYTLGAPAFIDGNNNKKNKTALEHNPECSHLKTYGYADEEGIFCYLGMENVQEDITHRLKVMSSAVEAAYEEADKDPSTLKVFVAPEFFFRGKDGTYDLYETEEMMIGRTHPREDFCGPICQILKGLESIAEQERFEDWLFLFGTVVVSEALPSHDPFDYMFYNFAPMYKGGKPVPAKDGQPRSGKRFLIPKRVVSNMDFLTPLRYLDNSTYKELLDEDIPAIPSASNSTIFNPFEKDHLNYDNQMWTKYKEEIEGLGYTMIEYAWFMMDNITFSVEICVDHDARIGVTNYLANVAAGPNRTLIPSGGDDQGIQYVPFPQNLAQISLVSSAGMNANANNLVLTSGGVLILQDGESNAKARQFWENIYQELYHMTKFEGGSEIIRRFPKITPTDVYFEYEVGRALAERPIYNNSTDTWKTEFDQIFSTKMHQPTIAVYDTLHIAQI